MCFSFNFMYTMQISRIFFKLFLCAKICVDLFKEPRRQYDGIETCSADLKWTPRKFISCHYFLPQKASDVLHAKEGPELFKCLPGNGMTLPDNKRKKSNIALRK